MRAAVFVALLAGCDGPDRGPRRRGPVEDIAITFVGPSTLVPGSTLVIEGAGFLPELAGPSTLTLSGTLDGARREAAMDATFVDYGRMEARWADIGAGSFAAKARVDTASSYDGTRHVSPPFPVDLELVDALTPRLVALEDDGRHVNDAITVRGDGLLLGGGEGQTFAVVEGCFRPSGSGRCGAVGPVEVPVRLADPLQRDEASFRFAPEIAGIEPGTFEGEVALLNRHADGLALASEALPLIRDIDPPYLVGFSPEAVSLGQIVTVEGGGFVGAGPGDPAAVTLLELDGRFSTDAGRFDIVLTLVAGLRDEDGRLVYVVNEEDALGRLVDVRRGAGSFTGTARPIVAWQDSTVEGSAVAVTLSLTPVKQVVWLQFEPSFVESLRQFGLRAASDAVVGRIVDVVRRDFAGVNLDVRTAEPTDFALYSVVEVSGPDPNGLGLLGYDNTPGKDVGNLRLHDTIGGVNALTQQDGYPGFGGVFIDSLFVFSHHPPDREADPDQADGAFDDLFDPVRPDRGERISEAEAADLGVIEDDLACPANGRAKQVRCAVFALGNLVGTTLSHEIAHSLGLADPDGASFHNTGDWVDAIMDGGSYRTFRERAEVEGEGPGRFCRVNYDYLRDILPTEDPDPVADRQACY